MGECLGPSFSEEPYAPLHQRMAEFAMAQAEREQNWRELGRADIKFTTDDGRIVSGTIRLPANKFVVLTVVSDGSPLGSVEGYSLGVSHGGFCNGRYITNKKTIIVETTTGQKVKAIGY